MVEQILLSSVSFDGVRERGGFGQPLHALYPQIRAVLVSELGSDTADLLAEPVVDRAHNRIDWYTKDDPDQPLIALSDLPEEQRQPVLDQINSLLERGREIAERYTASGDTQRIQLGAILKAALSPPTETDVFLVNDRPVVAHWGFSRDRPWVASGTALHGALSPSVPLSQISDMMIPEQEAAALQPVVASESASPPEPLTESATPKPPSETPLELPPELPPKASAEPLAHATPPQPEPGLSPEAKTPPLSETGLPPPVMENLDTALRYVVVGSRYFWSVVLLALLLALGAVFWSGTHRFVPSQSGQAAPLLPDAALDRALADARQTEQELRLRLEQRSAALAEQQRRCTEPVGTDTVAVSSTSPTSPIPSIPSVPSTSLTPSDPSAGSTPLTPAGSITAPATSEPTVADATRTPSIEPGSQRATRPDDVSPPTPDSRLPPTVPAMPKQAAPATGEPLVQALEEGLPSSRPSTVAPPLAEPTGEPLVPAKPTPEERQEFANRLSATGAATGEITATLLWDSHADLDLIVRCPSGQILDYLTPQGCGGTLDVDTNSARENLSEKPVENIFWPAGQAAPGVYKIAVRYEPRKDERNPQPVPFQVRLIHDSQEKVFKGTIRPRKTLQITDFTVVER